MAWLNLNMPNQTVINGLKAKKIKLPQMIFFFSSYSWSRVMRMCHFWNQNGPFVLNKSFLVQTTVITFIYLLTLFIVQNFEKILQQIQSYDDTLFFDPKWSICPKQNFFWKIIIILVYLLALFIVQNLERVLPADPELLGCAIFGSKMAHFPKWEYFQKTC